MRATWNQPINIEASRISIDYFAKHAAEVGYRACGYLWLHRPETFERALRAREKQVEMGWPVEAWDIAELKRRVPFIDRTDDLAGAVFGPRDGLLNPNLLKNHFRDCARNAGVMFDDRILVRSYSKAQYENDGVVLECDRFAKELSHEDRMEILCTSGRRELLGSRGQQEVSYRAKTVVNCAGAWASGLATVLGYESPCFAVRRQACIFDCREVDMNAYGMIVDTSGIYFHPEATHVLAGLANRGETPGFSYQYDGEQFFEEQIWPPLAERASAFERLKHVTGWAGLYEVSPDESAVIGRVEDGVAGKYGSIYEAHSFSGHGVMHSYAAGLALAEKILEGQYRTLNLSSLAGARFAKKEYVKETAVI